jgi:3-methyladenine DNA glycosylase/8-oxoguanine DNA glycosylase
MAVSATLAPHRARRTSRGTIQGIAERCRGQAGRQQRIALTTSTTPDAVGHVPIDGPFDLVGTLAPLWRGPGDPAFRFERATIWRASRTPDGPATTRLAEDPDGVEVMAWGPGAGWAIEAASALLGSDDDPLALHPRVPLLRDLQRRFAGIRLGRSAAVLEALVPAVLEQKVTGAQAVDGYRRLVRAHGEPAPGPRRLMVPPHPAVLAALPYYAFHPFGIERRRAETIGRAAALAPRLEAIVDLPLDRAYARMRSVPGIGPWTAAEVAVRALGDPDAVSVGDFHLPHLVAWALAGEPRGTDERMLELLEPYRGQRARVIRLLEASGLRPPRRGPRIAPRRIEAD